MKLSLGDQFFLVSNRHGINAGLSYLLSTLIPIAVIINIIAMIYIYNFKQDSFKQIFYIVYIVIPAIIILVIVIPVIIIHHAIKTIRESNKTEETIPLSLDQVIEENTSEQKKIREGILSEARNIYLPTLKKFKNDLARHEIIAEIIINDFEESILNTDFGVIQLSIYTSDYLNEVFYSFKICCSSNAKYNPITISTYEPYNINESFQDYNLGEITEQSLYEELVKFIKTSKVTKTGSKK